MNECIDKKGISMNRWVNKWMEGQMGGWLGGWVRHG